LTVMMVLDHRSSVTHILTDADSGCPAHDPSAGLVDCTARAGEPDMT